MYLRNISDIADSIQRKRKTEKEKEDRKFGDKVGLLQNCTITVSENKKTSLVKLR